MNNQVPVKFKIKGITFPRLDFVFIGASVGDDFDYAFRVEGLVSDDKNLKILFGVRLFSRDKVEEKTPKIQVTVEAIAEFEFEQILPRINHMKDVPMAGNLLAFMYPFIREKINYCFVNNGMSLFLPSVNTFQLVKDNFDNPNFRITDSRDEKEASRSEST